MTARLATGVGGYFTRADDFETIFDAREQKTVEKSGRREQSNVSLPGQSCHTELFLGFFFDGTRNNYEHSEKIGDSTHSNIARLYDCFPGMSVPGVLPRETDWDYQLARYSHFFRIYVPGVGTPFKEIEDDGKGTWGPASGRGGGPRIVWALMQAINSVHRYFHKRPLIDNDAASSLARFLELGHRRRMALTPDRARAERLQQEEFETANRMRSLLSRLHTAIRPHMSADGIAAPLKTDPGIVTRINISIFGFSRGATQARAFANWLISLCTLDASMLRRPKPSLGGFEVEFTFLGLLDTVASVGLANTMGGSLDGHAEWADAEASLRIAPEIASTVHLVAAHEVRRSFPCDSISIGAAIPGKCREVVFPGVHSDVGGGYGPGEQGKGRDGKGADLLSRIPLVYMYREARLAGVPLKLETAKQVVKERFQVTPETIKAFSEYIALCPTKSGTLTAIMREQRRMAIQWKLLRRVSGSAPLEATLSFERASNFDKNDLHSANLEFEREFSEYERWLHGKGKDFQPRSQSVGFAEDHLREWEDIACWRRTAAALAAPTCTMFDEYVHDSRAWFKLIPEKFLLFELSSGSPDSEAKLHELLQTWVRRLQYDRFVRKHDPRAVRMLTPEQTEAAEAYERNHQIPRMTNSGREPFIGAHAGYLRYRRVYAGGDSMLLSGIDRRVDPAATGIQIAANATTPTVAREFPVPAPTGASAAPPSASA